MGLITKLFGTRSEREVKRLQPTLNRILSLEEEYKNLSEEALKAKTSEFKDRLAQGQTLDDLLDAAFHLALFVGVLNAQEHLAAAGMGCTLTNHGHEQTADVQKAGGAGGKTGDLGALGELTGGILCLHVGRKLCDVGE